MRQELTKTKVIFLGFPRSTLETLIKAAEGESDNLRKSLSGTSRHQLVILERELRRTLSGHSQKSNSGRKLSPDQIRSIAKFQPEIEHLVNNFRAWNARKPELINFFENFALINNGKLLKLLISD